VYGFLDIMIITGLKAKVRRKLNELQKPANVKKFAVVLADHLNNCPKCARHFEANKKKLDWAVVRHILATDLKAGLKHEL